jgi:hypothetical protein
MPEPKVRKPVMKKQALAAAPKAALFLHPQTKFVELITNQLIDQFQTPLGPGYLEVFNEVVDVTGWKEIRVWVHVFVENYNTTPIDTSTARLELRFMHNFSRNSFDYEEAIFQTTVTSYIDGYAGKPIIGNQLRLICHPENLPPGPYTVSVTYLLLD